MLNPGLVKEGWYLLALSVVVGRKVFHLKMQQYYSDVSNAVLESLRMNQVQFNPW